MHTLITLLVLTVGFLSSFSCNAEFLPWDRYMISESVNLGAVCLDGSPYGYYLRQGAEATKFVIHIQGGGWCVSDQDCVDRSNSILGSSKAWPPTLPQDFVDETNGIVSPDPTFNPDFYNWTMVWLPYCDGASFSGDVNTPLKVGDSTLYFRGKKILQTVFDFLLKDTGLPKAKEVIITGTSAGGLATYMHVDYIATRLPNARVVGLPDAGYFMDARDVKGNPYYPNLYLWVFNTQNVTGGVNQACIQSKPKQSQWQCFYAAYTYPHVQTPLFVVNSLYDTWQLSNIIAPPGDGVDWSPCLNGQKQCDQQQLDTFKQFRANMISSMQAQGVTTKKGNGLFAVSCFIHALTVDNYFWDTPKINGKSMRQAFVDWYRGAPGPHVYVDCEWPCNPACKSI